MRRTRTELLLATALIASAVAGAPAQGGPSGLPRLLEPGFYVVPYAATGGTPSSLAFGPDTRKDEKGERLYVTDNASGDVLVVDDISGAGSPPQVFASGFRGPLGVVAARDGSLYVADAEQAREGPFGFRPYGRVWRVLDKNGDGVADEQYVVLKDLPNGRHNTNGMAFGPDGMLYVTNGNSTDDGVEGGESEVVPWSGSVIRVSPKAKGLSLAVLSPRKALIATGWRNVYDLAFSPVDPKTLFVPMNGVDDARKGSTGENPVDPGLEDSDDALFATKIDDNRIDDFGFPSCLFNEAKAGNLKPFENPNADVISKFGPCRKSVGRPVSSFGLHTSSNGLAFQTTKAWGPDHRHDLFVAEWGSLFGPPMGHDVVRVQLDKSGRRVTEQSVFLHLDFPLDVTFDRAGALYVADFSGQIFKVDRAP